MSILDFLLKLIAYIAPYFFIPWTFKWAGGVFASLAGMVNDRGKGIFDRNRNYRANTRKNQIQKTMEGKRNSHGVGELMRRAKFVDQGGLSLSGAGQRRYQHAKSSYIQQVAGKMVEQDGGRSGGDDDAMALIAKRGMTSERFIREYADLAKARAKEDGKELSDEKATNSARDALASFEGNFGAQVGTGTARVAAYKAWMASNTSAAMKEGNEEPEKEVYATAADLINDGLITAVDSAAIQKSNKMRGDRSGVGFSTTLKYAAQAAERARNGEEVLTSEDVKELRKDAVRGMDVGQIMGGRHESVAILAPTMYENLEDAIKGDEVAFNGLDYNKDDPKSVRQAQNTAIQRAMANIAAVQDISGQVSQLKNDHNIKAMNQKKIVLPGSTVEYSVPQVLDFMRQGQMPATDEKGEQIIDTKIRIVEQPDGTREQVTYTEPRTITLDNREFLARRRELMGSSSAAAEAARRQQTPPDGPIGGGFINTPGL